MKVSKTRVTFNTTDKKVTWDRLMSQITDRKCPFCGKEVTFDTFDFGIARIDGKLRIVDDSTICTLQLSKLYQEEDNIWDQ
jgi:hypothetical protein